MTLQFNYVRTEYSDDDLIKFAVEKDSKWARRELAARGVVDYIPGYDDGEELRRV